MISKAAMLGASGEFYPIIFHNINRMNLAIMRITGYPTDDAKWSI